MVNAKRDRKTLMMKKYVIIFALLSIVMNRNAILAYFNPPTDIINAHQNEIVLYSTSWCGYCAKVRTLLKKNNVSYVEYDIEKSAKANKEHKRLGGSGVPLLLINGKVVKGYNPDKILRLIDH